MMKKNILLLFLIFPLMFFSQESKLGYDCGWGGSATKAVAQVADLLAAKDYVSVTKLLYSENPVSHFLAVVVLQKLESDGKTVISEDDKTRISRLKQSEAIVEICSTCTLHYKMTLSGLFHSTEYVSEAINFFFPEKDILLKQ